MFYPNSCWYVLTSAAQLDVCKPHLSVQPTPIYRTCDMYVLFYCDIISTTTLTVLSPSTPCRLFSVWDPKGDPQSLVFLETSRSRLSISGPGTGSKASPHRPPDRIDFHSREHLTARSPPLALVSILFAMYLTPPCNWTVALNTRSFYKW